MRSRVRAVLRRIEDEFGDDHEDVIEEATEDDESDSDDPRTLARQFRRRRI